jgi:Zn-dependent peptidase ImmA (M78 family)
MLNISYSEQSQTGNGRFAYNLWRRSIETLGILIFQFEKIPSNEVWGFSLAERPFPVIAINIYLSPNARTFTMIHELVHILSTENGICDIDDYTPRGAQELRIEVFCNHAAAAALMPKPEFLNHPIVVTRSGPATDWEDGEISQIAISFGTSREAAVRRLLTFNRTTKEFYLLKRAQYQAQYLAQKEQNIEAPDTPFARDYAQRAISNLGQTFVGLILNSYHDKLITLADAAKYLDVRPQKVRRVQQLTIRRQ